MKNILLIKGVSRYNSDGRYVQEWAAAMRNFGCNTCVLDGYSLAQPKLFDHLIHTCHFDAVFDMNGACYQWVYNHMPKDVIYAMYLCDPPTSVREKLLLADERTIVFSLDNDHCEFARRYYPGVRHAYFIPLSGSAYPARVPYEERSIEILFTGTYQDPEKIKADLLARFPNGVMRVFVEDMMEDIVVNPEHTLADCLSAILAKYGQEVDDHDFEELMEEFYFVDFYGRFSYRDKVIRTLVDAGLPVHVFGNGWENFHPEHRENLIVCAGGSYAAQKALANAKIALNIMPWFKDGFQERIASAMQSGVVAVTDESKYILEHFEKGKELEIFSLKEIDALPDRIRYLLSHPQEAIAMTERADKKIPEHTWEARTYDMMRAIEESFGISLISEGNGQELEYGITYPDKETLRLDAYYELYRMAVLADNDIGKLESLNDLDAAYLLRQFESFLQKFSGKLEGMELSAYARKYLIPAAEHGPQEFTELFSMQCKALMGRLVGEEKELNWGLKV